MGDDKFEEGSMIADTGLDNVQRQSHVTCEGQDGTQERDLHVPDVDTCRPTAYVQEDAVLQPKMPTEIGSTLPTDEAHIDKDNLEITKLSMSVEKISIGSDSEFTAKPKLTAQFVIALLESLVKKSRSTLVSHGHHNIQSQQTSSNNRNIIQRSPEEQDERDVPCNLNILSMSQIEYVRNILDMEFSPQTQDQIMQDITSMETDEQVILMEHMSSEQMEHQIMPGNCSPQSSGYSSSTFDDSSQDTTYPPSPSFSETTDISNSSPRAELPNIEYNIAVNEYMTLSPQDPCTSGDSIISKQMQHVNQTYIVSPHQLVHTNPMTYRHIAPKCAQPIPIHTVPTAGELEEDLPHEEILRARRKIASVTREQLLEVDADGDTQIHFQLGEPGIAQLLALLERCEREGITHQLINSKNKLTQTPLFLAYTGIFVAGSDHKDAADKITILLKYNADPLIEIRPNADIGYVCLIHFVASMGNEGLPTMRRLLTMKTQEQLAIGCSSNQTVLHYAASSTNPNDEMVYELIRLGADLSLKEGRCGKTPLHYLVESCKFPMLKNVLLLAGPERAKSAIRAATFDFNTVLHIAASLRMQNINEHKKILELLLNYGAQSGARNGQGKRPLELIPKEQVVLRSAFKVRR